MRPDNSKSASSTGVFSAPYPASVNLTQYFETASKFQGKSSVELHDFLVKLKEKIVSLDATSSISNISILHYFYGYEETCYLRRVLFPFILDLKCNSKPNWELYQLTLEALLRKSILKCEYVENLKIALEIAIKNEFDFEFRIKVALYQIEEFIANASAPSLNDNMIWRKFYGILHKNFPHSFYQIVMIYPEIRSFLNFELGSTVYAPKLLGYWIVIRDYLYGHFHEEEGYNYVKANNMLQTNFDTGIVNSHSGNDQVYRRGSITDSVGSTVPKSVFSQAQTKSLSNGSCYAVSN